MAYRKLNLDRDKIDLCRNIASRIATPVERYIERHSTTSIESMVLNIFGAEGEPGGATIANIVVDKLSRDNLRLGVAWWFAKALVHTRLGVKELAQKIARGEVKFDDIPDVPAEKIKNAALELADSGIKKAKRTDAVLCDPLSEIFLRGKNMKRAFIDQHFSRMLCARAGVVANTDWRNYPDNVDDQGDSHHNLVRLFINEQFAIRAGLPPELTGFSHAFMLDPAAPDSFLYELADAQIMREIFPRSPIRYVLPAKLITGNATQNGSIIALFNMIAAITEQSVCFVDAPSLAAEADCLPKATQHISDEIVFTSNGRIDRRAHTVLDNTHRYLKKIEALGLMKAIEEGLFANTKRSDTDGTGLEGVFQKDRNYFNPVLDILRGVSIEPPVSIETPIAAEPPAVRPAPRAKHEEKPDAPKKKRRRGRRGGRKHKNARHRNHIKPVLKV